MTSPTAGQAHPYWYEWFVGIEEIIGLLRSDSDVESVALQVCGIKGWDDVVVKLKDNRYRLYQVKHSREDDRLTFGEIVSSGEGGSLLGSLFTSWQKLNNSKDKCKCVLHTNRIASTHHGKSKSGIRRPPLTDFLNWLTTSVAEMKTISEICPPDEWKDAWEEWTSALNTGNDDEKIAFMRSFTILTDQGDTDEIVQRVTRELAEIFGVNEQRVSPLVDALHRALRSWTTGGPPVTAETLCQSLVLPPEQGELAPAPPPPAPFFPGRLLPAEKLEEDLLSPAAESVFFLTAEPGSGKTSLVSWLTNRRSDRPFGALVGLRFFCFEPIRPEAPFIAADASRVRPAELWFSLLTQLREGLKGRLRELRVPLRNNLLEWRQARGHVLRLASFIGRESGRPFVIVVDGIDHAARSGQTAPQQAADFMGSLPGPDELRGTHIRFLVAGQPAAAYESYYPSWLVSSHDGVRKIELPGLEIDDVKKLYKATQSKLPESACEEAVRLIHDHARGNTLSTVFAVAEAERVTSIEELDDRLKSRKLADGPSAYYRSIWTSALQQISGTEIADDGLVVLLSIARRGVTADALAKAFAKSNNSPDWWERVLDALSPLLTHGTDGYRVRHNDVRVFLAERRTSLSQARKIRAASQLAELYRSSDSDRSATHLHLLDLLDMANRGIEWPKFFTVQWVIEAGAIGIEINQVHREGVEAVRRLPDAGEWSLLVPVACAIQTLERLSYFKQYEEEVDETQQELPPFLPSEASVKPVSEWKVDHMLALSRDAITLNEVGEKQRAISLLSRWLGGLEFGSVLKGISGLIDPHSPNDEIRLDQDAAKAFERLGVACGRLGWCPHFGITEASPELDVRCVFESGYASARSENCEVDTVEELFDGRLPRFLAAWDVALRAVAAQQRWVLVRDLLKYLAEYRNKLSANTRIEAAAWALQSGAHEDDPCWLDSVMMPNYGLPKEHWHKTNEDERLAPFVSAAYSIGWQRLDLNPRDIAANVYSNYDPENRHEDERAPILAVFRVATLIGRVDVLLRENVTDLNVLVTPSQIGEAFNSLWGPVMNGNWRSPVHTAARLATELVRVCGLLKGGYSNTALEHAIRYAQDYPVGPRRNSIWAVLGQHGRRDIQNAWLNHWLGKTGKVWELSRDEMHRIVRDLSPIAVHLGEHELVKFAKQRVQWLMIGYRSHKEYGFKPVLDWFRKVARIAPSSCRSAGYRLWSLCEECSRQGGDNRFSEELRVAITSALAACGASDAWLTVTRGMLTDVHWHNQAQTAFVDGVTIAIKNGWVPPSTEWPYIWASALALSYWHDESDNSSLRGLRDAFLQVQITSKERQLFINTLAKTQRSESLDKPPVVEPSDSSASQTDTSEDRRVETVEKQLVRNGRVSLTDAAELVGRLVDSNDAGQDQISRILAAIGAEYGGSWYQSFHRVPASLETIVKHVGDNQLWQIVKAVSRDASGSEEYSLSASANNLLELALARATQKGEVELLRGLNAQLDMHGLWVSSTPDQSFSSNALDEMLLPTLSWRDFAVRLVKVLLTSRSAEALNAALEGMHSLVDHDPTTIQALFAEPVDEWQTYWLLHASEVWSAKHTRAFTPIISSLQSVLLQGSLNERLQCWVILCRYSDALGEPRPDFHIQQTATSRIEIATSVQGWPLSTPGQRVGHTRFSDRLSSAKSTLRDLLECGWNFTNLSNEIFKALIEMRENPTQDQSNMLRRYNDITCHELLTETALSQAILPRLRSSHFTSRNLVRLAQAFLDNDEPWLQRCPPKRSTEEAWPSQDEWDRSEAPASDMEAKLATIAHTLDVPTGWRVIAARVVFCARGWDYVLQYWHEPYPEDRVISGSNPPSCPSGRTFLFWIDTAFEPSIHDQECVSGFFTGGRSRLHHARVEINPPRIWKEAFGWQPTSENPLVWLHGTNHVASYERLYGPIRDMDRSPVHMLPVVDRWLVSDFGFEQAERHFGVLRSRNKLSIDKFKE